MKTYRFKRGGLAFEDRTAPDGCSSSIAYLPAISVLPLIQHAGPAARRLVDVGDRVSEGMLVGRGDGHGSANVHATVPGRVIRLAHWRMADGRVSEALVIRMEGSFARLGRPKETFAWEGMSPADLQRLIGERGVVVMEGAGRPLADLIGELRRDEKARTIVVQAVGDDPWSAADRAVLHERAAAVAEGMAILARAMSPAACVVAYAQAQRRGVDALVGAAESFKLKPALAPLAARYPQHQKRLLGETLKPFARDRGLDLGRLLPFSPSTLAAVYDAVRLNSPLIERCLALGGDAVKHKQVLRARLGTRIGDIIAECGGFVAEPQRLVVGSPLTGWTVADLDTPVTKTTTAVVALSREAIGGSTPRPCMGCGDCRGVCPVGLDPERLYKLILAGRPAEADADGAGQCIACACCAAVCPSRLPLRAAIGLRADRGAKA
jgi:electron transport complex protein RnfC